MNNEVIILFPLNNEKLENMLYRSLEQFNLFDSNVTFLHCIKELNPSLLLTGYMDSKIDYEKVKQSTRKYMASEILTFYPKVKDNWKFKSISSTSPKQAILAEVNKNPNALIITAIERRSLLGNIFHSSMTEFLVKHANTNILIIK